MRVQREATERLIREAWFGRGRVAVYAIRLFGKILTNAVPSNAIDDGSGIGGGGGGGPDDDGAVSVSPETICMSWLSPPKTRPSSAL